jgi:TolB-like protein/DNA-binding winged helix-turn-helix (wHTH) protein/tetratricopeptide (TPR) repeat protein
MDSSHGPSRLRFGVFVVDVKSGDLWKHGHRIRLHVKPFEVLRALLERPGEVVTRKELQDRLWKADTFVEFEAGLNNAIGRLRDSLGDSADSPKYIETVPRRGYRFIAPVDIVGTRPDEQSPAAPAPRIDPSTTVAQAPVVPIATVAPSHARLPFVVTLLATLCVSVFALIFFRFMTVSPGIDSVAVLPFVTSNARPDSQDEYVAFGMTEALIAELSRVRELKVISQTSILRYKDVRKPLTDIARELGVGAIVEGSVLTEGDQVRITVQLIDASSDTHLWTDTYRPATAGVLGVQADLARSIAGEIRQRLTGQPIMAARSTPPIHPGAHEAYLKGRLFLSRRGEESMGRARDYFVQAITADPTHAAAHAGLADYYTLTDALSPALALPRARTHGLKALELDPELADAHVALAYVSFYGDWNWREAEDRFRQAIQIDPSHSQARTWFARLLGSIGRDSEAREQLQRALLLDPLAITVHDASAMQSFNARQFPSMIEQANKILELEPNDHRAYEHLAIAHLFLERFDEARSAAEKGMAILADEPLFVLILAAIEGRSGRGREASESFGRLERMSRDGYVPDFFLAIGALQTGRIDQALALLESAFRNRDPYMVLLNSLPWFDPIRNDPRFQELVAGMKFPRG